MYTISQYGDMINDSTRTAAYLRALQQTVKPGSVVVDIGTGTGILSLLACRFGARKVYAIEPSHAIHIAREVAAANGCTDRVEFIQRMSTEVTLPERADIIVSEIHGVLPLFQHSLLTIADARKRLLAPSGIVIPTLETLWAAVVDAPKLYSRCSTPWASNPYDLNLLAARRIVTNTWWRGRVEPSQLLTEAKCWGILDYATIENHDLSAEVQWTVESSGTGHGFLAWFDTVLVADIGFSNSPQSTELIFGCAFFPWSEPINLAVGDAVIIKIAADLVGKDYVWRWETRILDVADQARVKANFKQSTFFSEILSPAGLQKRAGTSTARLNSDGQIDSFVLTRMDGTTSSEEIARQLTQLFPRGFASFQDALTRVSDLAERYGAFPDAL